MSLVVLADIAPEFESLDTDLKTRILTLAQAQLSASVFGDLYDYAVALLTAHMLTIRTRQGKGGAVTNASEGALSLGFSSEASKLGWDTTSYGQELTRLVRSRTIGVLTTNGS